MKDAVTKVIDVIIQEDFHGAFQKLLERYNKCITTGWDYFEGDQSFMCVLSIKMPMRKKSVNLFNDPRTFVLLYILTREGSYLPSNRNSPKSEQIKNAPLAILISTKQFYPMIILGSPGENVHRLGAFLSVYIYNWEQTNDYKFTTSNLQIIITKLVQIL